MSSKEDDRDDEDDQFTKEELLLMLKEREDEIDELQRELELSKRDKKPKQSFNINADGDIDINELMEENTDLRERLSADAIQIKKLQDTLIDASAHNKVLEDEKNELDNKVREYMKKIDKLEKEILDTTKKSRAAESVHINAEKNKAEKIKETKELLNENDYLREENERLSDLLHTMEENAKLLEALIVKQDDDKNTHEAERDAQDILRQELQSRISHLEAELEQYATKLKFSEADVIALNNKIQSSENEYSTKLTMTDDELKKAKRELEALKKDNASLKDSTAFGAKLKELEKERAENVESLHLLDIMRIELESAISERDSLAKLVTRMEGNIDEEVAVKVLLEREKIKVLEIKNEKLSSRLSQEVARNQEIDAQCQKLSHEVDELANWKTIYESGHGMQELARYQKKLKEDNRRLSTAVEQSTNKLGMIMDMNNVLSASFDRLKIECGKSPDFVYPEYEINSEFMSDNNKLKAEMKILEGQVTSLEEECIRLRKNLKNHAGTYSEQGFKYSGMTADQLMLVNDFAFNLRQGNMDLPLNDRSRELLKENKRLKEEFDVHQLKIERYEREFGTIGPADNNDNNNGIGFELVGLRNDVQRLVRENRELRDRIMEMKNDMSLSRNDPTAGNQQTMMRASHSVNNLNPPQLHQPASVRGQQLLNSNILQLNLPPEKWTDDFKRLHAQLIECIEQLFEKEQELLEHQNIVKNMENALVQVKQHTASLYYDFSVKSTNWDNREKQYKQESLDLHNECDDLKNKLKRVQEVIDVIQKDDRESIEAKLAELNRKVIIYEVNEAILSRKYTSLAEQLHLEQQMKVQLEYDFVDMENSLKKRILYLEQYKATVGSRLGLMQARLNKSVPVDDFTSVLAEVESLREDNLQIIRREVEARISSLKMREQEEELKLTKKEMAQLQLEMVTQQKSVEQCARELEHERLLTTRALAAVHSGDVSSIVSEMATYRGESSRLEVELAASKKKLANIQHQLEVTANVSLSLETRVKELESREDEVSKRDNDARQIAYELKNMYDGGLNREDSEKLRNELLKCSYDLDAAVQESLRQKELAEIASLQAQSIGSFKQQHLDEMRELQDICLKLESRTDDDLLIGKMQRQLMSTKSSYKQFSRKYQLLRGNMRQRELALRALETRLDQREVAVLSMQENYRMEISAIKKALRSVTEMVFDRENSTGTGGTDTSPADASNQVSPYLIFKSKADDVVTLNKKLSVVSEKVKQLAGMAESALARLSQAEEVANSQKSQAEDLRTEKIVLTQRCADLQALSQGKKKQSTIASRIVSLSEELKAFKLSSLQQKRKIETLQFEKRHLQNIINGMEVNVGNLEQVQVTAETLNLFGSGLDNNKEFELDDSDIMEEDQQSGRDFTSPRENIVDRIFSENAGTRPSQEFGRREVRKSNEGKTLRKSHDTNAVISDLKNLSNDEIITRLQNLSKQLMASRKDLSDMKLNHSHLMSRCTEMESIIDEKNQKLAYCERIFAEEGLPQPFSQDGLYDSFDFRHKTPHHMQIEQDKLQEAATATIGSLRSLLDEKNRQLEKYRDKIDELQRDNRVKSKADLRAEELLNHLNQDDEDGEGVGWTRKSKNLDVAESDAYLKKEKLNTKLLDQIDQADVIMKDKEQIINDLEEKLNAALSHRERAEIRCGSALEEMEAMKQDMITLVKKLQASEERYNSVFYGSNQSEAGYEDEDYYSEEAEVKADDADNIRADSKDNNDTEMARSVRPPQDNNNENTNRQLYRLKQQKQLNMYNQQKLVELQKVVKSKDSKMRQYREIIVKLKEEFIKSEEDHAMAVVTASSVMTKKVGTGEMVMVNSEELRELKVQVSDLRQGLNQAKVDLDKARRAREKIIQSKHAMQEEVRKLGSALSRAEAQSVSTQESLQRTRKELEDTKKKEVRLREKLKQYLGPGGAENIQNMANDDAAPATGSKKELEALRAENASLRNMVESSADPSRKSAGYVLGNDGSQFARDGSGVDEYRQNMHTKWENEKKLQKRLATIETRLREKVEENQDLMNQLKHARDTAHTAMANKDEMHRKVSAVTKLTQESRKLTIEDLLAIEQSRNRVFALEEENRKLKRKLDVDMTNEIMSLRHQLTVAQSNADTVMAELQESESKRKQAAASGGNSRGLRDSEDRFLMEQKLKDDIERLRRQRVELEAALLERDARALENRFDLESRQDEIDRLSRRLREVESAYSSAVVLFENQKAMASETKPQPQQQQQQQRVMTHLQDNYVGVSSKNRSKRELELEGVIDAMKRVIEKLKLENERFRRGGTQDEEKKIVEYEKKVILEKKKSDQLQTELKACQEKLKEHENSNQKLVQKQQQTALLRKQLSTKDDEINKLKDEIDRISHAKADIEDSLLTAEAKIEKLELNIQHSSRPGSNVNNPQLKTLEQKLSEAKREYDMNVNELNELISEIRIENDDLRSQLLKANARAQELILQSNPNQRDYMRSIPDNTNIAELDNLREENAKLKKELSAFDMEFFEEIETLKWSYAEAIKKLRVYENASR